MSASGIINISGTITGYPSGTTTLSLAISLTNAIDDVLTTGLSVGYNAISVPSSAVMCIITPPTNNTVSMQLKGDTADVGIPIHKTNPTLLSINGATVIGITAGTSGVGATEFRFF